MGLVADASAYLSVDGPNNFIRSAWDRLRYVPGGSVIFSRLIGRAAPYTGTIKANVEELREGYARVSMKDRPGLRNHLRSVHAVALFNLAELTGNVAVGYSQPDDARFIPAGINIEYIKKARGTITGTCECPRIESNERREYLVPVEMRDSSGQIVAKATLRTLVGPKKSRR